MILIPINHSKKIKKLITYLQIKPKQFSFYTKNFSKIDNNN